MRRCHKCVTISWIDDGGGNYRLLSETREKRSCENPESTVTKYTSANATVMYETTYLCIREHLQHYIVDDWARACLATCRNKERGS
jgi:hypothetical protein